MSTPSTTSGSGWEPPSPEELQQMLPQYEISGFLGRGGMGAVYRAKQIRLDRDVAIKVLPETLTQGGDDEMKFAERFELEAQAMAKFNHPSIVAVFDFGETSEGQLYFVMEFVEGMDIHHYLRENGGSLTQEYALSITAHVLDALDYAHARGIVHRDIKPANILLNSEGQVKIADFGLAKALNDGEEYDKPALTMSNVALGTPDFVAPEALDGDGVPDHRADLYAVGVMLYQMLTGKIPRGQFPSPSEILPDLDPRVDEIIQQSMQYDPVDRYATASSMRLALDPVISAPISRVNTVRKASAPKQANSPSPLSKNSEIKKPGLAGKIYMIATACAFVATLVFVFGRSDSQSAPAPAPADTGRTSSLLAETEKISAEPKVAGGNSEQQAPPLQEAEKVNETDPHPASPVQLTTPDEITSPVMGSAAGPSTGAPPAGATIDQPFENSLGMRFVPVPITGGISDGKHILFSIWETRVQDYRVFLDANPEVEKLTPRFPQGDDHPAVMTEYRSAESFCHWLTASELAMGNLSEGQHYRIPTDHEWSCAIGIGELENPGATPASKDKAISRVWPWGDTWPPPQGTINLYGEENAGLGLHGKPKDHLKNYADDYRFTAPVDALVTNRFGLFHLSGNVLEWTSDWNDESKSRRVARSAAWLNTPGGFFMSSARSFLPETAKGDAIGFRVVLDLNTAAPVQDAGTAAGNAPPNPPEATSATGTATMEVAPTVSPLSTVPGLEQRLVQYLEYRQNLIGGLSEKYLGALESRFEAAIAAGDLTLATSFESEKNAVTNLQASLLELNKDPFSSITSSSTLDPLPSGSPAGLVDLRGIWTSERSKLSAQLTSNLVQSLQALEIELTKASDLENASKVKALKDSMNQNASAPASSPPPEENSPDAGTTAEVKTFENSLGMQFRSLEVAGETIMLSVYETTVANYRKFLRSNRDVNWTEPNYRLRDKQAATLMSWFDAQAFCEWLTEEEREKQIIGENDAYTLPEVLELRTATGLVQSYDKETDKTTLSSKYLWGNEWPIPRVVGNLYGEEDLENASPQKPPLKGYNDGETIIAEVGSYDPTPSGFYDLIGNAGEWCLDWFNEDEVNKCVFGGSYSTNSEARLRSAFRLFQEPNRRSTAHGFRVVLRQNVETP
ncbi:MAG: bifunctional serine/threonine-protein kinase/formylglycine-generating enzyme family protein [Verrucomicrobiales bacterium]|nr:bifunctional serine/threonine-protein kinase/formylglycine-generating enzyme family protein [Verrucomicrobiales bacterium]